jgi:hypothetical protein
VPATTCPPPGSGFLEQFLLVLRDEGHQDRRVRNGHHCLFLPLDALLV